jgi:hypothetical protein
MSISSLDGLLKPEKSAVSGKRTEVPLATSWVVSWKLVVMTLLLQHSKEFRAKPGVA